MSTHAFAVQGPGALAADAITQIGPNITLPAGGPWIIFGLWGQVVKATATADEGTGGHLLVNALSGDLTPDPAPGRYPLIGNQAGVGAITSPNQVPLNIWPVNWSAAGKSVISLSYHQHLQSAQAEEIAAGILFGDAIPEKRPLVFCDGVRAAFSAATEQTIGTITLSEKASRIVGILADVNKGDVWSPVQEVLVTIRLASDDVKMPPAEFPCNRAFDAGLGVIAGGSASPQSQFIPVDIPVEGGARIVCYATSSIAVADNCEVSIYLAYE